MKFKVASLSPLLYRLGRPAWITGAWVDPESQRRRRYCRLTRDGRRVITEQRTCGHRFVVAINRITEASNA